jgi:hypothetical protein
VRVLIALAFILCASLLHASPLDLIYDAPGEFWGKLDSSANNSDANHAQFNIEQGIRFVHLKWLTWYVGMTGWEQVGITRSNYWAYGVKNTTWISHCTFGMEEQNYVFSTPPAATNALVGYAALNLDWNVKDYLK